jgi:uncharacterized protein YlxW (UPF0749 family)
VNSERTALIGQLRTVQEHVENLEASVSALKTSLESARQHTAMLEGTIDRYRNRAALRLRDAILRLPVLGSTARLAARALTRTPKR